MPEKTPATKPL